MTGEDKNTRYFIELDLEKMKIVRWSFGNRLQLVEENPKNQDYIRLYLTKGQYNKLDKKKSDK